MKTILFLSTLVLFTSCNQNNKQQQPLELCYNQSAKVWEEALPIGNGRLGGMIFGGISEDHIQLNEETIWAGEPGNNLPKDFKKVLPQVRKLVFEGKYKEAENLTMTKIPRHAPKWNNYGMPYQTVGDFYIDFGEMSNATHYQRELNISDAISSVSFEKDGIQYKREYFATAIDQIIAIHLTANKKGSITCQLRYTSPQKHNCYVSDKKLFMHGISSDVANKKGKVKFDAIAYPILEGGQLTSSDSTLQITNADIATIYVSIGTNFKNYKDISNDEHQVAMDYLQNALSKNYSSLKKDHIQDYHKYFDRVKLNLGTTDSIKNPTDQRIKDFATANDPQLVELYYQFGRYLLISSSRNGTQPANLQGIWNHQLHPAWDSKYTVNINTEMNYWPAETSNLSEMTEPLIHMVKDLSVTGQQTAKEMYGARGWAMHHNTDLWRITGPVDGAFYGMWPMGGAWLSQHIWYHYIYTGDTDFLKEIYPVLKGITTFYVDILQTEPTHGWKVVCPCMSPENTHPYGTSMSAGNTMDNQLVFDTFSNFISACHILGFDKAFADTVSYMKTQLPPMQIGQYNQLQEWLFDWDKTTDHHRHVSHLYGLFPSNQISPFRNPELFEAAKNSLIYRGDKSTGWSMGWKVNLWARLLDGNRAYKLIADQLNPAPIEKKGQHGGTYPNLFDAHPPFQIDGNFGCTSGITEMLLQSHDGFIYLLPALPDCWSSGSVKGLVARGGFTIDMNWSNSKLKELTVHSKLGGNCRIRVANELQSNVDLRIIEEDSSNPNSFYETSNIAQPLISSKAKLEKLSLPKTRIYDFDTKKGKDYFLEKKQ